jgi:hypothetical protein
MQPSPAVPFALLAAPWLAPAAVRHAGAQRRSNPDLCARRDMMRISKTPPQPASCLVRISSAALATPGTLRHGGFRLSKCFVIGMTDVTTIANMSDISRLIQNNRTVAEPMVKPTRFDFILQAERWVAMNGRSDQRKPRKATQQFIIRQTTQARAECEAMPNAIEIRCQDSKCSILRFETKRMARRVVPRTQGYEDRGRIGLQDCSAPFDKTAAVELPVVFKVKNKWRGHLRIADINRRNLSYSLADTDRLGSKPLAN